VFAGRYPAGTSGNRFEDPTGCYRVPAKGSRSRTTRTRNSNSFRRLCWSWPWVQLERFSCSKVTTISNRDELERFAVAAVGAFLAGYGSTNQSAAPSKRTTGRKTSDGTKQNLVIRRSVKSPD
jgi:hypothetical protein